jgi:cobalt-zinc-cadmium resistance protein CzcA
MVQTTTLAEKLIKEKFPEVKQAVTRIGSAEIPTDPMPVERADMLISLKPKKEWTSASTKDELMEKMEETLTTIPGMEVEMSQPIQMRNNELITGIKQDVAIMIYGNDLNLLSSSANRVADLIKNIEGVSEPKVEKVQGLPQIQVEYDRDRMSRYGISISAANNILETAFAGKVAGYVYENDRKFDIVVRMDSTLRTDINAVKNLYIPMTNGGHVPLDQIANVEFKEAPSQITHDNGERRIYVGFNVHGRDVKSTVNEIQKILDKKLTLPTGYHISYGGEFKNLEEATERLSIAVPIALLLIICLLYATLKNMRETLFVFSAIPLSLIGGITALWLRGMPFSISAGVGFIALFGVAVLNGIVLVGQFNNFEKEGIKNIRERVLRGCQLRLRPVIMTALVASFGFLPMALSHGDGAEVQRPLATVVIGGLITSTILTLVVLPAIYETFTNSKDENKI